MKLAGFIEFAVERKANHLRIIFGIGISYHRDQSHGSTSDHWQGYRIIPADHHKIGWLVFDDLVDLLEVATGFLCSKYILTFVGNSQLGISRHIHTRAGRNVIHYY